MNKELNIDALIGLAVTTAIMRLDYNNQTTATEIEEDNSWGAIEKLALEYLDFVGTDTSQMEIDKYVVAQCFWGMEDVELDEVLAEN